MQTESEIEELKRQLHSHPVLSGPHPAASAGVMSLHEMHTTNSHEMRERETTLREGPLRLRSRRGKAPPVDPFTGDDIAIQLDEWLPSLE